MSSPVNNSNDDNQAISPDTAALIARAKKSFIFSLSLLLVGIIAIIAIVIFKGDKVEQVEASKYSAGVLVTPVGAKILSAVPSEGMIAITYVIDNKIKLRLIDGATGAVIRDIDFASQ